MDRLIHPQQRDTPAAMGANALGAISLSLVLIATASAVSQALEWAGVIEIGPPFSFIQPYLGILIWPGIVLGIIGILRPRRRRRAAMAGVVIGMLVAAFYTGVLFVALQFVQSFLPRPVSDDSLSDGSGIIYTVATDGATIKTITYTTPFSSGGVIPFETVENAPATFEERLGIPGEAIMLGMVNLSATADETASTITCTIYAYGSVISTSTATGPGATVVCAGTTVPIEGPLRQPSPEPDDAETTAQKDQL